ncbi:methyl-accepting chemotaxis protein [Seleniivibrio woodruffii]|uniref:methyl-accepting chemotaxis protein n=1 Tax=Seleniivibrio woodruffii TaxID=1078050 RepID=UPI0026EB3496|nr:methyl-accepting chemotaxis protein [Seleniivibrio woodruffii]
MIRSLSSKLLFFILILLALMLAAGGAYYFIFLHNLRETRAAAFSAEMAQGVENAVKIKLDTIQTLSITLSHNRKIIESLESGDPKKAVKELALIEKEYHSVDFKGTGFHLIRADMHSFYRSFDPKRGDDISFRSMVKKVVETKSPVSGVEIGKAGMGLRALSPIFSEDGRFIGIMELTMGVGSISRQFENEKNFFILLVDKNAVDTAAYMEKASDVEIGDKYLTANKKWFSDKTVTWAEKAPFEELERTGKALNDEALYGLHEMKDANGKVYGAALVGTTRAEFDARTATLINAVQFMFLISGFMILIMVAFIMFVLRRMFIAPVKQLGDFFAGMGTDLTVRFGYTGRDEIGMVAEKLNEFIANFRQIVIEIKSASREVQSSTDTINNMVDAVIGDFRVLSDKSESISASSQEMTSTSTDIAKSCHISAAASNNTTDTTQKGIKAVNDSVDQLMLISDRIAGTSEVVSKLDEKSNEIVSIISVIKDIADQTNLLALNAAIEAARAGEAGRGFAVVADEVRKLAEKSATATKEIEAMLSGIRKDTDTAVSQMSERVAEVKEGSTQADTAGENLTVILSQISEVAAQINQIAAAAEEQNVIIRGISDDITEVSHIAKNSTDRVSNLVAESESMTRVSRQLEGLVSKFKA